MSTNNTNNSSEGVVTELPCYYAKSKTCPKGYDEEAQSMTGINFYNNN